MIIRSIYIAQLVYKYTVLRCDENKTPNSATYRQTIKQIFKQF